MKKISLFYLMKFSSDFMLVYPFYTLIFKTRGLDEIAIGWLLAIWSLSVVIFEIPMGLISDRMKRKRALLLSAFFKAMAFGLWIIPGGFVPMAAGFIFWGLSGATASGTEEAWLYETLFLENRQNQYAKIKGRGNFFSAMGIALAAPVGGLLLPMGADLVIMASIAVTIFCGILFLGFGDPPRTAMPEELDDAEDIENGFIKDLLPAIKEVIFNKAILTMMLFSGLLLIVAGVLDEWDPLFLVDLGLTPFWIGTWLTIRLLCESLGAMSAHKMEKHLQSPRIMILLAGFGVIPLIGLGFAPNLFWLIPYAVFYFIYAGLSVQAETRIQKEMHGAHRATVLSLKSLLENAVGIVLIVITGFVGQTSGMNKIWLMMGFYIIAVIPVLAGMTWVFFGKSRS
jgi:MFS family permease